MAILYVHGFEGYSPDDVGFADPVSGLNLNGKLRIDLTRVTVDMSLVFDCQFTVPGELVRTQGFEGLRREVLQGVEDLLAGWREKHRWPESPAAVPPPTLPLSPLLSPTALLGEREV